MKQRSKKYFNRKKEQGNSIPEYIWALTNPKLKIVATEPVLNQIGEVIDEMLHCSYTMESDMWLTPAK